MCSARISSHAPIGAGTWIDHRRSDHPVMLEPDITLTLGALTLNATLRIPEHPIGTVLFAHGSGSGRHSPRNKYVADRLVASGFATLLFDLLTVREEAIDATTSEFRFNIVLLTDRLIAATRWAEQQSELAHRPLGYFGASTGAAAALAAAAQIGQIGAVVSRGGRPDLAGARLERVRAATLLIVGGDDKDVLALNRTALAELTGTARLEIVPGASHLFVEPGALERVAALAAAWFRQYLAMPEVREPKS